MTIISSRERRTLTMNASFIDEYVLESRDRPPEPFGFDCLPDKRYRQQDQERRFFQFLRPPNSFGALKIERSDLLPPSTRSCPT
jgi:hypothetical protein